MGVIFKALKRRLLSSSAHQLVVTTTTGLTKPKTLIILDCERESDKGVIVDTRIHIPKKFYPSKQRNESLLIVTPNIHLCLSHYTQLVKTMWMRFF